MALSYNTIASNIIDSILIVNPAVDIKVGSVVRDIFIDPQAEQLATLYIYLNSTAQAQSVLTARNQQLDRLAYNFGITRNAAVAASANVTIIIQNGIAAPTILNIGDQFNTNPDQNGNIQTFINTQTTLLSTNQTQITLPVVNITPGVAGNVAANTIVNSSYSFASSVYNQYPATGGANIESDASLALRIPYSASGRYINVYNGILGLSNQIENVVGKPFIVTPDDIASRGMYTTDVYLREDAGYFGTVNQETAPANTNDYIFQTQPLFADNPINNIILLNPNNTSTNSVISSNAYTLLPDGSDAQGFYIGSTKAKQKLHWLIAPPPVPYVISYNVDKPVIDAQSLFDQYNELTNDLLFKGAPSYPLFINLNLSVVAGANYATIYQNAYNNLINLFNNLEIGQTLTKNEVEYAILQDSNITDVNIINLDTTYQVVLTIDSTGTILSPGTGFASIPESLISPFGYYLQTDTEALGSNNPLSIYGIISSLWIGTPKYINSVANSDNNKGTQNTYELSNLIQSPGIQDSQTLQNISTNWSSTNPLNIYDANNNALIVNLNSLPPTSIIGQLSFNIVQSNINTTGTLNYLTLAPSLVSPIVLYSGMNITNQYATYLPNGLLLSSANVYKNGTPLIPTTLGSTGDFNYLNPDGSTSTSGPVVNQNTNLISLSFNTPPASTDVLQFGLLNPSISVTYGTG